MSRLDLSSIPVRTGTGYPDPFAEAVNGRSRQALAEAGGLTQFGANLIELQPGAASSQRHWHTHEDEFVMVVSGELTLVTDEGETLMRAGDCAAFPAGRENGHHLVNRSWGNALFLVVGPKDPDDRAVYPDIDLAYDGKTDSYSHKDGTPYPKRDKNAPMAAAAATVPPVEEHVLAPRVYRSE
ncbi:cupin domain-containing protein [Massilia sp. TN1-12]|uniref:cupin domain-containing protein n=1 Tax=Massilia paldalensis TaxID=3377675 RepID=UPI00384D555F